MISPGFLWRYGGANMCSPNGCDKGSLFKIDMGDEFTQSNFIPIAQNARLVGDKPLTVEMRTVGAAHIY
jgi:hypothetical protein